MGLPHFGQGFDGNFGFAMFWFLKGRARQMLPDAVGDSNLVEARPGQKLRFLFGLCPPDVAVVIFLAPVPPLPVGCPVA